MKLKIVTEHGNPPHTGVQWIENSDGDKDTAHWDGKIWRYDETAGDHLWGEPYWCPILAWVDEREDV